MKLLWGVVFLLFTSPISAQENGTPLVNRAQLEEKFYPADSTAPAAILYTSVTNRVEPDGFDWKMVTRIETQIKIYTKSGYEYANKQIFYLKEEAYGYGCNVTHAATYNLEGDEIKKTSLLKTDIYDEALNEYFYTKKINMPNVKEGCIIEYAYEVVSPSIHIFPEWHFQRSIPVKVSDYQAVIPTFFTYTKYVRGNIEVKELLNKKITEDRIENTVLKYRATNVPAYKKEPFSGNVMNYVSAIWFEMSSANLTANKRDVKDLSSNWSSVANKLFHSKSFGDQINDASKYLMTEVKALLKPGMSYSEKADAIFYYVQNRMTWNEDDDYTTDKGIKKAFETKIGNTAEINLMLMVMLRLAGIDSHPVILSTRDNGIALHPNYSSYNYVIVSATIEGKTVLLDATSKYATPGLLPKRAVNFKGRLLKKDGTTEESDLVPTQKSKSVLNLLATIDENGVVSGDVRNNMYDYYAYEFRQIYEKSIDSVFIEVNQKLYPGLIMSLHTVKNQAVLTQPLIESYQFTHSSAVDVMGDNLYFKPMLYLSEEESPFIDKERLYPIDFVFPYQKKYTFSIAFPKGYTVDFLPEPLKLELPEGLGSFTYAISVTGNYIQCAISQDINYALIEKEYYPQLKDFFDKIAQKQGEHVVLKKG